MKIMIVGIGKLGSTVAWMILREVQPKTLILNDIVDLKGEVMDLQHACKGSFIKSLVTTKLERADYIIITAGYPRTKDSEIHRTAENMEILNNIAMDIVIYLKKHTKIIVMTNPVETMTNFVQSCLRYHNVYNPEEELMKMRDGRELGWEIVKSKGYTNWGPAVSVVRLIKRLEGIN